LDEAAKNKPDARKPDGAILDLTELIRAVEGEGQIEEGEGPAVEIADGADAAVAAEEGEDDISEEELAAMLTSLQGNLQQIETELKAIIPDSATPNPEKKAHQTAVAAGLEPSPTTERRRLSSPLENSMFPKVNVHNKNFTQFYTPPEPTNHHNPGFEQELAKRKPAPKKRHPEEERQRLVKAEHVLSTTKAMKDELTGLYLDAMKQKVRQQRANIKAHDAKVLAKKRKKIDQLIISSKGARAMQDGNAIELQNKVGYSAAPPDNRNRESLKGAFGDEYLNRVPKSSYYMESVYEAEGKKLPRQSTLAAGKSWFKTKEAGPGGLRGGGSARSQRLLDSPTPLPVAVEFTGEPNQTLRPEKPTKQESWSRRWSPPPRPKTAQAVPRPAMPSLGLEQGWGRKAFPAELHSKAKEANAALKREQAHASEAAKHSRASRRIQATIRLSEMVKMCKRNMRVAQELVQSYNLHELLKDGAADASEPAEEPGPGRETMNFFMASGDGVQWENPEKEEDVGAQHTIWHVAAADKKDVGGGDEEGDEDADDEELLATHRSEEPVAIQYGNYRHTHTPNTNWAATAHAGVRSWRPTHAPGDGYAYLPAKPSPPPPPVSLTMEALEATSTILESNYRGNRMWVMADGWG
jgi:hypothetical protein